LEEKREEKNSDLEGVASAQKKRNLKQGKRRNEERTSPRTIYRRTKGTSPKRRTRKAQVGRTECGRKAF